MGAGTVQKDDGGGRRRRRRGSARPMAEINVTPFVDVMLVLLIIFMVAAPLLTVGVPVELPKTAAGALPVDQEEPLTVTITAEGSIQIQTTETQRDQVMQVMGALNAGGFSNIGLVTDIGGPALDGADQ
jgi:biopolymer transport protein TolR